MDSHKDIDRGWAWVVLGASIFNLTLLGAMTAANGMFLTEFLRHFEGSTAYISLVCSLFISLQMLLGPVAGVLCNMYGIRVAWMFGAALLTLGLVSASFANNVPQLIVSYGLVAGMGLGTVYNPSLIVAGHYFRKRRVLANGIATSSVGIGMMSGPHLIGWLIKQYGWRFALTGFGCILAHMVVAGSLIFPLKKTRINNSIFCKQKFPDNEDNDATSKENSILVSGNTKTASSCCGRSRKSSSFSGKEENKTRYMLGVWRKKMFWILCVHFVFSMTGYSIQIVHFPSYVQSVHVSLTKVPSLYTAYGITMTLARIFTGIVCNNVKVQLTVIYTIGQCIMGATVMLMPLLAKGFVHLIIYQILFAISYGSSYSLLAPIVIEAFGVDSVATVFGFLLCLGGIGYLVGPIIAGKLYDITSSYSGGFHIGGLMVLLGSFLLLLIPIFKKRKRRRDRKQKDDLQMIEEISPEFPSQKQES